MMNTDVLVALSGGIDSAATILILKNKGYRVSAVTFDINNNLQEIQSARELARKLDVEIEVLDLREEFQDTIVKYFIDGYLSGITPAPCSLCNPTIKWKTLLEKADKKGIEKIATGHYCQIKRTNELYYVHCGIDPVKDQSYYLWGVGQDVLSRAITPLGERTKSEIRDMMTASGFEYMSKRIESMSVCFLKRGGYADFLKSRVGGLEKLDGGDVINKQSEVVGRHNGYPFYTIGQKRGFEGGGYVIETDPVRNQIKVGELNDLYTNEIELKDCMSANIEELFGSRNLSVKIRGIGINPSGYCRVIKKANSLQVITEDKMYAIANGQPAVFYIEDRVVGGGIII